MATLAYCIRKMGKGMDPGIAKHLRDLSQDYQDMDMNKEESEVQAVQDVLDMLDKDYDKVVGEIHGRMKDEILRFETKPGRWFNFDFVRNNIPKLNARITELQKMFWDSKTFAKSDAYDGTYPIPVAGGIIAARQTKKYAKDPGYKKKVEGAIKDIQDNLIGANHTRMILFGTPDPGGVYGVKYSILKSKPTKTKVKATPGVNIGRAWANEARSKYPNTTYLGNISVRESFQNSIDAVVEGIENGEIKKGNIDIRVYNKGDHESTDTEHPIRDRVFDDTLLGGTYHPYYSNSFQITDNGIGMSDVDIDDKFLDLHGTGKDKPNRFGGFGIATAVVIGPHDSAVWMLESRDNYHDVWRATDPDPAVTVAELETPRKGTLVRVEADADIIDRNAKRHIETTELSKDLSVTFNGKKVNNPFARRKFEESIDILNEGGEQTELSMKYYPRAPEGYNKKMILRLSNEALGIKLTQGFRDIYNEGFSGTLIVDITTKATPGSRDYPLTDSRMDLRWKGTQAADKIVAKHSVDPLSAKRSTVDHKWYGLSSRSEWKKTIEKTKTDRGYNRLVDTVTKIWNKSQEGAGKLSLKEEAQTAVGEKKNLPFRNQTIPYTPIDQLNIKVDIGFKGYRGGSMFMAKHILAYEAVARMSAASAGAKIETFYPFLSLLVDGGQVEAEYAALTGQMGMNPLAIDKDSTKSPLHYAIYLKGLIDHEFTHAFQGAHDEKFSSARESMHKKTAHLFPQTLKIAEAVLDMPDTELTTERVIEKEVIKEITKEIEVPIETILSEYKPLPMRQGQLFDSQTLIREPTGDTPNDIKLYYPSRKKGLPRQLRLFDQRVVGRNSGRVSPSEREGGRGSDQLPLPQEIVKIGKRDGAFDGTDLTRAEEAVAKKAKKLPKYYRRLKGKNLPDQYVVRILQSKFHDNKWTFYSLTESAFAKGMKGNRLKIKGQKLFDTEGEARVALAEIAKDRGWIPVKPAFGGGFVETTPEAIEARADVLRTMTRGVEYEYWGIAKDSRAAKIIEGATDLATIKPELLTVNELRGLARLTGAPETGTKAEMMEGIIKHREVFDALNDYTTLDNPIQRIADDFTKSDLRKHAAVMGAKIAGSKTDIADSLWRKHVQDRYHTVKGYVRFFEDIKKPIPKDIQEIWAEERALFQRTWGDTSSEVLIDESTSTVNVKDLVKKIDSPATIKAIQNVTHKAQGNDLGVQLGILGVEYPSIKKALRKAFDKLKLRQAQAAAETLTDEQLELLAVERVLAMANDFMGAFKGEKNSMSKIVSDYMNDVPIKNESIIRQVFYGETPVRIQGPIDQYMATRQAKEEYRKRYLKDQGITLDDIKRLFKGTNVFQHADGTVSVTTPTGHELRIKSVDSVDVNNAHFEARVGRALKEGETAIGKYADGRIELHKDLADNWTLTHETVHWLEDVGYVTPGEVDTLRNHIQGLHEKGQWDPKNIKDVGGAEDRANFIAWSINNRAKNTSIINKIIQKFKDLMDGFVGLFKLTPQSIVRDIETGKVFKRVNEENFGQIFLDPMFQTTVYHGSPYSFNKFITEKIGTGEGIQAFGWGLYFTDLESIARGYANSLGGKINVAQDWLKQQLNVTKVKEEVTKIFKGDKEKIDAALYLWNAMGTRQGAIKTSQIEQAYQWMKDLNKHSMADAKRIVDGVAETLGMQVGSRNLYKATLHKGKKPGEYEWLEWDKAPTKEQLAKIIKQAEKEGVSVHRLKHWHDKKLDKYDGTNLGRGENIYNELASAVRDMDDKYLRNVNTELSKIAKELDNYKVDYFGKYKDKKGQSLKDKYDRLMDEKLEKSNIQEPQKAASLFLLRAGIDGIKYPTGTLSGVQQGKFLLNGKQIPKEANVLAKWATDKTMPADVFNKHYIKEIDSMENEGVLSDSFSKKLRTAKRSDFTIEEPKFNYAVFDESVVDIEKHEQYSTATPQDQQFMKDHGNSAAAEHVARSLRDYATMSWGRVGRWMSRMKEVGIGENPDTTAWERLLFTPIHYFNKVPAAGAMVEDATKRSDNYYKGLNWIEKDANNKSRMEVGKKLKKTNKKEYKRLNKYLDDNDMNKHGYTVRLAPQTEESTDRVYNIKDPDGKIVGTADDYDDGWGEAVRLEVAALAEQGYSELAQDWIQGTREMTHNVFNIMRGAINDLIRRYNSKGIPLPKVATWVDGQKVEVDLKVALAKMGDMRGYYMPRIRKPGNWSLYAKPKKGYEDKLHPFLGHFEMKSFAAAEASKKKYDNYIVDIVPLNKMPEDVFQIAGQVVAFQSMMNEALDQVSGNMKKGMAADVMKALERAQLEMGKTLAEGVANIFKGRGVRSHMIMRNDAVGTKVWKGYEEDSIQRMAKYIRGIAAGEAKKKMMLDMLRHMTGTDISWTEFKAEHAKAGLEANYPDYLTFVKNRRIDPIKQRNIFHDALTYMEDMGRNDEGVDRLIGNIKGLAVLKYLGGRVSAPIVNLTALATSVPASMRGFAKIPMRKVPGLLVEATKGWREYRRALKNGNEADIPQWMQKMYEEIEDRGWHTAQYNKEALSALKSKVGNGYDTMIETLMLGFGATEMLNRMSTIAGAYIGQHKRNQKEWDAAGAAEKKMLHEKWMATAKEVSDKAHGVYSKANRPHYARGANPLARLAQMFYVFKTFSHNYLQTMYDLGFKSKDRTALLYMALSPAIVGGAAASPLIKVMMEAFGLMPGAPEEPEEAVYEWFENNFGEPVEQMVRLGAFGLGGHGVSLKGSLEIGVTDIPTSLKDLVGAPGSLVSDVVVGGRSILRGDWSKGLERMSPNFIGSGIKAWREATVGVTTSSNAPLFYGRDTVKLDTIEAIFRTLSFNPARIAKIRERQWKERSVEHSMSELRYDIYARIKAFYNQPKSKRSKAKYASILEEIRTYNALVQRMSKPYPPITAQSVKNNLRRAFKPSKYERQRRLP